MSKKITPKMVERASRKAEQAVKEQSDLSADTQPFDGVEMEGIEVRPVSAFDMILSSQLQEAEISELELSAVWAFLLCQKDAGKLWKMSKTPAIIINKALEWSMSISPKQYMAMANYAGEQFEKFNSIMEEELDETGDGEKGNV
jgi:hypothetical protein